MNIAISEERNKHNLLKDFKICLPKILNTRASNVSLILKKKKAKQEKEEKKSHCNLFYRFGTYKHSSYLKC